LDKIFHSETATFDVVGRIYLSGNLCHVLRRVSAFKIHLSLPFPDEVVVIGVQVHGHLVESFQRNDTLVEGQIEFIFERAGVARLDHLKQLMDHKLGLVSERESKVPPCGDLDADLGDGEGARVSEGDIRIGETPQGEIARVHADDAGLDGWRDRGGENQGGSGEPGRDGRNRCSDGSERGGDGRSRGNPVRPGSGGGRDPRGSEDEKDQEEESCERRLYGTVHGCFTRKNTSMPGLFP
jgi:hypothetical protein